MLKLHVKKPYFTLLKQLFKHHRRDRLHTAKIRYKSASIIDLRIEALTTNPGGNSMYDPDAKSRVSAKQNKQNIVIHVCCDTFILFYYVCFCLQILLCIIDIYSSNKVV